jgi:16S rRNA processing protein RimM
LGRFVKPVGLGGALKLAQSPDFWDAALASAHLQAGSDRGRTPVRIVAMRPHSPGVCVVRLAAVGDRDAAAALVGAELWLAADAADVAEPETLRPFQVRGMRVERADGTAVGEVADLLAMPAQPVLVVRGEGREHLVPVVPAIVLAVDREAGVVRIDPPPGLLELDG